jgi:hypothetical protein
MTQPSARLGTNADPPRRLSYVGNAWAGWVEFGFLASRLPLETVTFKKH